MTQKARVATVQVGSAEVEGLMFPDGSFGISATQAFRIIDENIARQGHASRQLKALMGKDFQPAKTSTELNPNKAVVLKLPEFELLLVKADRAGHKGAQDFRDMMVGLSLHQLWCDAFGIEFDEEERQQWVKFRARHKKQYHPYLTIWLKVDGCEGKEYGRQVNIFKACANLPIKCLDEYSENELQALNEAEVSYNTLRRIGYSHEKALKHI